MFNFTTQTVYNNISASNMKVADSGKPALRIGNTRFDAEDILDIYVKKPTVENLAKVTFDLSDLKETVDDGNGGTASQFVPGIYRIVLYIGLSMNSQDSLYANPFVYKGKPFFIEFPIKSATETATAVGDRLVNIANKYMLFIAGEKILNVTNSSGEVTFEGINGYQQIKKAILQKYDTDAIKVDCCTNEGDFVDVITGVPATWITNPNGVVTVDNKTITEDGTARAIADNEVAIAPGIEAFGDYNWMIHNLRLPTLANTYFWAVNKAEMPVVGQQYTQFIIRICKERDGISGEIVGARAKSVTTHVLYVAGNAALNAATTTTPADKVYKELYTLASAKIIGGDTNGSADKKLKDPFGTLND